MSECKRFATLRTVAAILVAAIVLSPILAQAGSLNGTVIDKSNTQALFGAIVTVTSSDPASEVRGSATVEDGTYEITGIPAGEYTVTISYVGFVASRTTSVNIAESGAQSLDAALVPTAVNIDAISVTASRRQEKILEAPASVSVVESENIQERTTLTPTEHIKGLPAVDVATTGLNQSNVVVRGFNNIFSGALLVLTDNRIARVPSLRFNAYNFMPIINQDIERIEIVSGPGSALYGPNSAAGVMHIVTRSPFGSEGTTFSLGGGERDLVIGSVRHAGSYQDRFGYKITAEYYQGNDWESEEPLEPDTIQLYKLSTSEPTGRETIGDSRPNVRDFDIEKMATEARIDYHFDNNTSIIVNGGFNRSSSIELTGLGAGQAIDWTYYFGQTRFRYKDLFAQAFVNASDAGDTYLLQTGQMIVDKSKLWAAQIQHSYAPSENVGLTYGADALFTRPETEETINGRNEAVDGIDEFGFYLQTDWQATEKLKLVGAARYDNHNRLEDPVFSPRAAAVYQPNDNHNIRFTYNRAFATPDNNNLYLDMLSAADPYGIGAAFEPALGYRPDINIRVQGVPERGFHWNINANGAQFRSPFAPADPRGLTMSDFIEFNDPIFTNVMWNTGRGATIAGFEDALAALGVPAPMIDTLSTSMDAVTPTMVAGVDNTLMSFNIDTHDFDPVTTADIANIDRLRPAITQTFELGYKGVVADRFRFSIDAYRTKKHDFMGPLTVETPNVFLDPATLQAYLGPEFAAALADPANAAHAAALAVLNDPMYGGNGDTTSVDELTALFTSGAAGIPFGTVTPGEAYDPTAVLITYRNFGDISFYGADFAFAYHLNSFWNFGGSYSYISKNFFEKDEDQVHDINLNAPKHKFGLSLQFVEPKYGFRARARVRFVDAFKMTSPFKGSLVKSYRVVDLNLGVDLIRGTRLGLSVQNLLDKRHTEFVGAPEIGRLAILRLTHTM